MSIIGPRFDPTAMQRLNPNDPMDAVDCWCTDSHIEAGDTVDYCPRHGTEPDWYLVDESDRDQQKTTRREHGAPWKEVAR